MNRAVGLCSLHLAVWLGCLHVAAYMHGGLSWLRINCTVGAFLPMDFWVVNEVIAARKTSGSRKFMMKLAYWTIVSAGLSAICFTGLFISRSGASGERHSFGVGYYAYIVCFLALTVFVLFQTFLNLRDLSGNSRLELKVWLLGGCGMTLTILCTMALNLATESRLFIHLEPLFVLIFFAGTAFTITTYRIFDAGQILRIAFNRLILVMAVGGAAYCAFVLSGTLLPASLGVLLAIVVTLIAAPVVRESWTGGSTFIPRPRSPGRPLSRRRRRKCGWRTSRSDSWTSSGDGARRSTPCCLPRRRARRRSRGPRPATRWRRSGSCGGSPPSG